METKNKQSWTDGEIEKMRDAYLDRQQVICPICNGEVTIKKEAGEKHLKKEYVGTHLFLVFSCEKCGIVEPKPYRTHP